MKNIIQLIFVLIVISLFLCFKHFPEQFSQVPLFAVVVFVAPFILSWIGKQPVNFIAVPMDLLMGLAFVNCLIFMRAPLVAEDFLVASFVVLILFSKNTKPDLNSVNRFFLRIGQAIAVLYSTYCFLMLLSL